MSAPSGWYPRRGEVYWAMMDKRRPVLILSIDALNRRRLDVTIVPLTSVERRAFRLHVLVPGREIGGRGDSWAKCEHVNTIEKRDLFQLMGTISPATLANVETAVRSALGLAGPETKADGA